MKLTATDLGELADVAIAAATEAGRMIAASRPKDIQHKSEDGSLASQVVTEVDRRSEEIILGMLDPTRARFDLGLLTEERVDDGGRLSASQFWCIDPLDGTLPFIEGSAGYAVSIALVSRDGTPLIGVVYDPVESSLLHAVNGAGAFRDGEPWPPDSGTGGDVLSVFADRSFGHRGDRDALVDALGLLANEMGLDGVYLQETGGAVMNAWGVLANAPACYFKEPKPAGGGSVWDFAATACLFHERGAVATDIHGGPLDLNRRDSTFLNHRGVLFASTEELAARLRAFHEGLDTQP